MKKSHRWAVLAAVLSLSYLQLPCRGPRAGADREPAWPGPSIALLDVSRIFKNHARFKGMMDDMKADVERAEAQVKAERDAITKLAETLAGVPQGNARLQPDGRRAGQAAGRSCSVQVQLQKNEFLQREAKIYHNVYQEIWQATDYFCKQNGIDMVLRVQRRRGRRRPARQRADLHQQAGGLVSTAAWTSRDDLAGIESDGDQSGPRQPRGSGGPHT